MEYDLEWKKYPEDPRYWVSENGDVYSDCSRRGPIIYKRTPRPNGYIATSINGKNTYLHRIVARTFIGIIPYKYEVNHIDGNKGNNNYKNLEICTSSHNSRHAFKNGLNHKGEKHGMTKFKENDIVNIFNLKYDGTSVTDISEIYKVHNKTIYNILNRELWGHIEIDSTKLGSVKI